MRVATRRERERSGARAKQALCSLTDSNSNVIHYKYIYLVYQHSRSTRQMPSSAHLHTLDYRSGAHVRGRTIQVSY